MSHKSLERTESAWIQPLANNINTMNQNQPDNSDFELPSSFNVNVFFTKVQHCRYLCGACGENVLEQELGEHHSGEHASTPFIFEMYELFEVDEHFKCDICESEQFEADLKQHLIDSHRHELINHYYVGEPYMSTVAASSSASSSASSMSSTSPQPAPLMSLEPFSDIETMYVPGHYLCLACGVSNIHGKNLQKHRQKLHANISKCVNIFSQQANRQKVRCTMCKKWLFKKNVEKHCKNYHSYVIDGPVNDGFLNIRISTTEFHKMQKQNRIYEHNGIQYLKDSQ